ncbi:hypothetical protein VTK26DRAFT_8163 [Humicola hyalothermophila]
MTGQESNTLGEPRSRSSRETDQAVDESSDVDGDFAAEQKMLSQKRRAAKDSPESRLQKALPFVSTFSPNIRPLTISDLDACIALENAAFTNPEHRASPEKFEYRLTVCPELSLGVFLTVVPPPPPKDDPSSSSGCHHPAAALSAIETFPHARPVETDRADGAVSVLLAHIVATRCRGDVISDADMAVPKGWRLRKSRWKGRKTGDGEGGGGGDGGEEKEKEKRKIGDGEGEGKVKDEEVKEDAGHCEGGRTVGLHSLAVLPRLQRCGIGQMVMRAYLDQMKNSGLVERVALICRDHLVSYYERSGFTHVGESKAQFGGGGWHDMVYDLPLPAKKGI